MTEDEYMEAGESFDISPLRSKPLSSDRDDEDEEESASVKYYISAPLRSVKYEHKTI